MWPILTCWQHANYNKINRDCIPVISGQTSHNLCTRSYITEREEYFKMLRHRATEKCKMTCFIPIEIPYVSNAHPCDCMHCNLDVFKNLRKVILHHFIRSRLLTYSYTTKDVIIASKGLPLCSTKLQKTYRVPVITYSLHHYAQLQTKHV